MYTIFSNTKFNSFLWFFSLFSKIFLKNSCILLNIRMFCLCLKIILRAQFHIQTLWFISIHDLVFLNYKYEVRTIIISIFAVLWNVQFLVMSLQKTFNRKKIVEFEKYTQVHDMMKIIVGKRNAIAIWLFFILTCLFLFRSKIHFSIQFL